MGAALMWACAVPALAANCPVCVDGVPVGMAEVRGGQTFLPVRTVFEACGVRVHWENGSVIARDSDYRSVGLRVGSDTMYVFHDELGEHPEKLPNAPFTLDGKMYVPVRAVSEALGCEVRWLADARCVSVKSRVTQGVHGSALDIKPATGEILRAGQVLAQVPMLVNVDTMDANGSKTAGGNYLLVLDDWESGAVTVRHYQYVWLNPKTGEFVTSKEAPYLGDRVGVIERDGKICLPGDDVAYLIDDVAGSVLGEYDLKAAAREIAPEDETRWCAVWFNDDYLLVRNFDLTCWGLLDLASGSMLDITDDILTDDVRARAEEVIWPLASLWPVREQFADDEEFKAEYIWSSLRHMDGQLDAHLELLFRGEEDGALKFELLVLGDNYERLTEIEIIVKL